jgi:lipoprotein signal peptidase
MQWVIILQLLKAEYPKNSNVILIIKRLLIIIACDIFYIVKRLGAPLTQAFGALIGNFLDRSFHQDNSKQR